MISSLRGFVRKGEHPLVTVDVHGVGYEVQCTASLFESLQEGQEAHVHTFTFVREDRLELFGFKDLFERKLFMHIISIPGIGPRIALQITGVPRDILCHAVKAEDARALSHLKGVGRKTSEKLLLELTQLAEQGVLTPSAGGEMPVGGGIDDDALEALTNLGYDRRTILIKLREVPSEKATTEERVRHVLQML